MAGQGAYEVARMSVSRRAALRLATAIGGVGVVLKGACDKRGALADHVREDRAVEIEWLRYTDAAGRELGQIRPYRMLDITDHDGIVTPLGQRDLSVLLRVRNTGIADLVVAPSAFALWDTGGFLHRPYDVYASTDGDVLRDSSLHHGNNSYVVGADYSLTEAPIVPRAERSGDVTFRVPADAWFAGLLFTPEPERVLVLADFRRTATVIID